MKESVINLSQASKWGQDIYILPFSGDWFQLEQRLVKAVHVVLTRRPARISSLALFEQGIMNWRDHSLVPEKSVVLLPSSCEAHLHTLSNLQASTLHSYKIVAISSSLAEETCCMQGHPAWRATLHEGPHCMQGQAGICSTTWVTWISGIGSSH